VSTATNVLAPHTRAPGPPGTVVFCACTHTCTDDTTCGGSDIDSGGTVPSAATSMAAAVPLTAATGTSTVMWTSWWLVPGGNVTHSGRAARMSRAHSSMGPPTADDAVSAA